MEKGRSGIIVSELKHHAPFTALGAVSGIVLMFLFRNLPANISYKLFYIFHPLHVILSALVTSAMYRRYKCSSDRRACNLLGLLIIGYVGSVGIATISDSLMPYLGEAILKMPHRHAHIGFIEEWWIVNPAAILGIAIAYFWPVTKFPHSGHVLISTWASVFHVMMAAAHPMGGFMYLAVFVFLFLAVWVPCCVSDIVFPLLFVNGGKKHEH
jgi:hypothetical protein